MSKWHFYLDGRDKIAKAHTRGYRITFTCEAYSGADIVLTPSDMKLSSDTLQQHLDLGAVLIQVKNGEDLSASITDQRLFESLLRMTTWDASPYQCGLLLTGIFENIRGQLYINGRRTHITWKAYKGALNSWIIRGGSVYPIIQPDELQEFIDTLGNKLFVGDPFLKASQSKSRKKFRIEGKKFSKGMTLRQKARLAKQNVDPNDVRHLLVNMDGLSNKTVQLVYQYMKDQKMTPNMGNFVELAKMGKLPEIRGIGAKISDKILLQLGYDPKDYK